MALMVVVPDGGVSTEEARSVFGFMKPVYPTVEMRVLSGATGTPRGEAHSHSVREHCWLREGQARVPV